MNEFYRLCAAAIVALCAVLVLREAHSSFAETAASFFGICIMTRVLMNIADLVQFLRDLADGSGAEGQLELLLKAAGIAYITDFTADICRDSGVGAVASYVEILGKTELIMLSLPLISELCELSFTLLKL